MIACMHSCIALLCSLVRRFVRSRRSTQSTRQAPSKLTRAPATRGLALTRTTENSLSTQNRAGPHDAGSGRNMVRGSLARAGTPVDGAPRRRRLRSGCWMERGQGGFTLLARVRLAAWPDEVSFQRRAGCRGLAGWSVRYGVDGGVLCKVGDRCRVGLEGLVVR